MTGENGGDMHDFAFSSLSLRLIRGDDLIQLPVLLLLLLLLLVLLFAFFCGAGSVSV